MTMTHSNPPSPASAPAIQATGLTREFGSGNTLVKVLRGLDFEVAQGELSFLVGPSGCGKTTLISILAGILSPTTGEVTVFGERLDGLSARQLAAFRLNNIGFVFQQFNLLPALTAAENAAVPLLAKGVARGRAVAKGRELLSSLGLEKHLNKFPNQLSGGQQQRVAIARALIHEPRLIVCDEPTASLDAKSGHQVMTLMREIAVRPSSAVIVVTHDSRIYDFADRMIEMEDGRISRIAGRDQIADTNA
jgi:putative ABC transport system ATP-binding protein